MPRRIFINTLCNIVSFSVAFSKQKTMDIQAAKDSRHEIYG